MILFIPACLLLTFLLLIKYQVEWRESLLVASLVCSSLLVAITEVLSALTKLTAANVALSWGIVFGVMLVASVLLQTYKLEQRKILESCKNWCQRDPFTVFIIVNLLAVTVLLAISGYACSPNSPDSMTYHMARVAHWIQNQTLTFYPTTLYRQLYVQPGSEFWILNIQLLAGSDRFANFVSWYCYIGTMVLVSLLAKTLRLNPKEQFLSAAFFASLPPAVLQASSTMNDLIVTYWIVAAVYLLMKMSGVSQQAQTRPTQIPLTDWLVAGGCLGMALFAKATAYVLCAPFLLFASVMIWPLAKMRVLQGYCTMALESLLINGGHYLRNWSCFHSPMGTSMEATSNSNAFNAAFGMAPLFSNLLRSIAVDLSTPLPAVNMGMSVFVIVILRFLGIDPNDLQTTWLTGYPFVLMTYPFDESVSGCPLHFLLCAGALMWCIFSKSAKTKLLPGFAISIIASYVLFCITIKWTAGCVRYHIPMFALAAPTTILWLRTFVTSTMIKAIVTVLLLLAYPCVLFNDLRPLVGNSNIFSLSRQQQYFIGAPQFQELYAALESSLLKNNCKSLAVSCGWNSWEYPIFSIKPLEHVEQTEVYNQSSRLHDPSANRNNRPTMLLEILDTGWPKPHAKEFDNDWEKVWQSGIHILYRRRTIVEH